MMTDALMSVASMACAATAAMCLMLVGRKYLQAWFGARVAYAFWLIVPVAMIASLLPAAIVYEVQQPQPAEYMAIAPSGVSQETFVTVADGRETLVSDTDYGAFLWGALIAVWASGLLVKFGIMFWQQARLISGAGLRNISGNIFKASGVDVGPAVVGVIKPRVIVPENFHSVFSEKERQLILAHEQSHIQAGDLQANVIAALVKAINWFNPLVYIAFNYFRMDQEFACDERVMRTHHAQRKLYAETLLKSQLLFQHTAPFSCAWKPSGMHPLTQRVGKLKNGEPTMTRRKLGVAALAVVAITVGSGAWATLASHTVYIENRAEPYVAVEDDLASAQGFALVTAILERERSHARALVKAGADVNYFLPGEGTPLFIAADQGDLGMVNMLIAAGADVNKPAPGEGNPLIGAAGSRNLEVARLLIKHGADVNGFVLYDETPLIQAVQNNDFAMTKLLVENGADVNLRVKTGNIGKRRSEHRSPLGQAELRASANIIKYLKAQGATPVLSAED